MQRYNIKYYHICSDGLICLEPADDGEFVRYEEVEKELEKIQKKLNKEQDILLECYD